MKLQQIEVTWLDGNEVLTLSELARVSALSAAELLELVDYGALVPLAPAPQEPLFSAHCVTPLRSASKLRLDYDLDLFTVAILMGYFHQIETLEGQLRSLQARLSAAGA